VKEVYMEPKFNPEQHAIVPHENSLPFESEVEFSEPAIEVLYGRAIEVLRLILPSAVGELSDIERTGLRADLNDRLRKVEQIIADVYVEKNAIASQEVGSQAAFADQSITIEAYREQEKVYRRSTEQLNELMRYLDDGSRHLRAWLAELDVIAQ
jgi:hypothetical protein